MLKLKLTIVLLGIYFFSHSQDIFPYEMYSLHFDIEDYTKDAKRAFDKEGIITQKGAYHALTISVYGTMCADEYMKTGDSYYLDQVKNQYKYFADTSRLIINPEDSAIGLPYHFDYHGMKAPWYSGLTQGMATSFLLRYYKLSGDSSALNIASKVVLHMLKDESDDGTIGKTHEGLTWIEEYPRSKGSKSVLNGFVNGLIGLKEYIDFFPLDTNAERIHNECYSALFETIRKYDKSNWTSYNRNGSGISNFYIRLQIQQFDHLFELYKDERFRLQMQLWSKFAFNKFDKLGKFYKKKSYQFAHEIMNEQNDYCFSDTMAFIKGLTVVKDVQKSLVKKKIVTIALPVLTHYSKLKFTGKGNRKFTLQYLKAGSIVNEVSYKKRDSIEGVSPLSFDELKIVSKRKIKNISNIDLTYYDYKNQELPMFLFIDGLGKRKLIKDIPHKLNCHKTDVENAIVFYRYSSNKNGLKSAVYDIKNTFDLSDEFIPNESGFYEFFISYDLYSPSSSIKNLELIESGNSN